MGKPVPKRFLPPSHKGHKEKSLSDWSFRPTGSSGRAGGLRFFIFFAEKNLRDLRVFVVKIKLAKGKVESGS